MKVTSITRQIKNPERVSVYIDGSYRFSLTLDQLLREKIKTGDDVSQDRLDDLLLLSRQEKFRLKVLGWVLLRPRSVLEVRQYIRRQKYKNTELGQIDWIVDDLLRRGIVDDDLFAQWWVERTSRTRKSSAQLQSELASKGIDRSIIKQVLVDRLDENVLHKLIEELRKKSKYKDNEKLARHLQSKGFRYSSIIDALALAAGES